MNKLFTLFLGVLLSTSIAFAETTITMKGKWSVICDEVQVSEHNTYYKSLETAINQTKDCDILPPMRFEVRSTNDPLEKQVIMSWKAPTSRVDGSQLGLEEIQGYQLYSGSSQESLDKFDYVEGLSKSYVLPVGIYYFAISTVADSGEGSKSETIRVEVM